MGAPLFPPHLDTDLVRPFYDGLAAGELRLPACPDCGRVYWYPPEVTPCHPERDLEWRTLSPEGEVYTFTTIVRSLLPGDDGSRAPYRIVLVEPDDAPGARIVSLFAGAEDREPACGMRVRLRPVAAGDHMLPAFEPIP